MKDIFEIGSVLSGSTRSESSTSDPTETATFTGTAVSDSSQGLVEVDIDGRIIEAETYPAVFAGDTVIVTSVAGTPYISAVIGRGDEVTETIQEAQDRFFLTSNAPTISFFPDGTVLPENITFAAWIQQGSRGARVSYEGTFKIEVSADGESWQEFDTINASSVSVASADLEEQINGFLFVQVTLYEIPVEDEETEETETGETVEEESEPIELATLLVSRINESANFIHKNDAGLWMNLEEDPSKYNEGSYARVYSDGFETGTDGVASSRLLDKIIQLGINDPDAIVEFCNGLGTIEQTIDPWNRALMRIYGKYGVVLGFDDIPGDDLNGSASVRAWNRTDNNGETYPEIILTAGAESGTAELKVDGLGEGRWDSSGSLYFNARGGYGFNNPSAFRNALGVGTLLWSGDLGSGSITVPELSNYVLFSVSLVGAATPLLCFSLPTSTVFRGNGGDISATPAMSVYAANLTRSGNTLTYVVAGQMNVAATAITTRNIAAIYGIV